MISISSDWGEDYAVRELNLAIGDSKGSEEERLGGSGDGHP